MRLLASTCQSDCVHSPTVTRTSDDRKRSQQHRVLGRFGATLTSADAPRTFGRAHDLVDGGHGGASPMAAPRRFATSGEHLQPAQDQAMLVVSVGPLVP
jgi:hypothetical protein